MQNHASKSGIYLKTNCTLLIENVNPDKKGNFRPGPINLKHGAYISFFSSRDFEAKLKEVRAEHQKMQKDSTGNN